MARPKMENEKDKKQAISVTLKPWQIELLKKIGNGNVSNGVRMMVDTFEKIKYKREKQGGKNEKTNVN